MKEIEECEIMLVKTSTETKIHDLAWMIGSLLLLLGISSGAIALLLISPSPAETTTIPQPSQAPLELSLLRAGATVNGDVTTSNTISPQGLTIPSLWWAKEQFGGDLLTNWIAYPAQGADAGRVDLLVDRQNWGSIDYIQRYEFLNHFGAVARDYGYNVRVFNEQKQLLATYTCNFSSSPSQCYIQLDATGKARIRGSTQ